MLTLIEKIYIWYSLKIFYLNYISKIFSLSFKKCVHSISSNSCEYTNYSRCSCGCFSVPYHSSKMQPEVLQEGKGTDSVSNFTSAALYVLAITSSVMSLGLPQEDNFPHHRTCWKFTFLHLDSIPGRVCSNRCKVSGGLLLTF